MVLKILKYSFFTWATGGVVVPGLLAMLGFMKNRPPTGTEVCLWLLGLGVLGLAVGIRYDRVVKRLRDRKPGDTPPVPQSPIPAAIGLLTRRKPQKGGIVTFLQLAGVLLLFSDLLVVIQPKIDIPLAVGFGAAGILLLLFGIFFGRAWNSAARPWNFDGLLWNANSGVWSSASCAITIDPESIDAAVKSALSVDLIPDGDAAALPVQPAPLELLITLVAPDKSGYTDTFAVRDRAGSLHALEDFYLLADSTLHEFHSSFGVTKTRRGTLPERLRRIGETLGFPCGTATHPLVVTLNVLPPLVQTPSPEETALRTGFGLAGSLVGDAVDKGRSQHRNWLMRNLVDGEPGHDPATSLTAIASRFKWQLVVDGALAD